MQSEPNMQLERGGMTKLGQRRRFPSDQVLCRGNAGKLGVIWDDLPSCKGAVVAENKGSFCQHGCFLRTAAESTAL